MHNSCVTEIRNYKHFKVFIPKYIHFRKDFFLYSLYISLSLFFLFLLSANSFSNNTLWVLLLCQQSFSNSGCHIFQMMDISFWGENLCLLTLTDFYEYTSILHVCSESYRITPVCICCICHVQYTATCGVYIADWEWDGVLAARSSLCPEACTLIHSFIYCFIWIVLQLVNFGQDFIFIWSCCSRVVYVITI